MSTITSRVGRSFEREELLYGALILNTELMLVGIHALVGTSSATSLAGLLQYLYPLVWINAGLLAIVKTTPPPVSTAQRRKAVVVGAAYFLVLAAIGGIIRPGSPGIESYLQFNLLQLPPGWNPMLAYFGTTVSVTLIPFKLVGYAALSYLIYVMVLDAAGLSLGTLTGVFSCVSCVLGILVPTISSVLGGAGAVLGQLTPESYGASTVVFVVSLALLYYRPFGR